jgi:retron-type reverse transcriptase
MPTTNIQEEFLSLTNFQLAWERVLRSSHIENKDRIALRVFASNVDFYLRLLIEEIRSNTYIPMQAHKLYLPKTSRTLRTIPVLSIRDRIVYQAIGNIIIQEAIPYLSILGDRHIFAHLPQPKDSLFPLKPWIDQFSGFSQKYEEMWKQGNRWVVEADISAFYSSIDHQLLTDLIRQRWVSDENLLALLNTCLTKWSPHEKGPELHSGLPQGYETSDLLSTLFLLPIDEKMVVGYRYLRYVDDIRILTPDQNTASKGLVSLDLALQARALVLQTKKNSYS